MVLLNAVTSGSGNIGFVIGPGRSGTTLLYKLLCLHPDVAYLSNLEHRLPWLPPALTGRVRLRRYRDKLRHWFRDEGNAYLVRRPWGRKMLPVPVEGEGVYRHSGIPLFPTADYQPSPEAATRLSSTFEQLRRAGGASLLLSKRTANNRRLPALASMFPRAMYLYLLRDGRDVAHSLARVDWWNGHQLWWDRQQRTPAEAVEDGEQMLQLCARNWVEEIRSIEQGLRQVGEQQILRLRYEALLAAPLRETRRVLDFFGLDCPDEYADVVAGLRLSSASGRWQRNWSTSEIDLVNREQAEQLMQLGYLP